MRTATERNTHSKEIDLSRNATENMQYECTDETSSNCSSSSSVQQSTMSMRTENFKKPQEMEHEKDINDQNILNKQNEKLNKPCKNGNCYCFTSDSDDFRMAKNKNRSKQTKPRKPEFEDHGNYNQSCSRDTDMESFTSLDSSTDLNQRTVLPSILKTNKNIRKENSEFPKNVLTTKCKTFVCEKSTNRIPIIHIIQEFHKNSVISEVRINRAQQNQVRYDQKSNCKKKADVKQNIELGKKNIIHKVQKVKDSTKNIFLDNTDISKEEILAHKNKVRLRYSGGQLYQKRIGCESFKHYKDYKSPPKKPPRSVSSCSEKSKIEDEEIIDNMPQSPSVLDNFSKTKISESKRNKNIRKTFPLDNETKIIDSQYDQNNIVFNYPLIENEKHMNENINFGWVRPDTEIVGMLESNRKLNQLKTYQQNPEPQIGWQIPPKLDIDTVDGISEILPNDSHNFAKNMESKSTPVKSDFTNATPSSSVKKQLKEFICNSSKKDIKNSPNHNKLGLSSSFREKAKIGAKVFLVNSKQKLVELVTGRSDKDILVTSTGTSKRNVAVQTFADHFSDNINDNVLNNNCLEGEETNHRTRTFSLQQSPAGNYISSSAKKHEFDFNRTINSPKSDRNTQRKLSFSPKKLIKNFNYRPVCIGQTTSDNHYYKSFDNHINKDFTLSSINDILLNIRAKLETSDNHAENTFREIHERENNLKTSLEMKENDDLKTLYKISAQAEIHNSPQNPIYSECEEEKIFITGSPSNRSLNEISHYYIDENPNAIYARVNKITKSCNNTGDNNYADIQQTIKADFLKRSELYLHNLTNDKNNINDEWKSSQIRNKRSIDDVRMGSMISFEDGKEVEYESVNDISYSVITQNKTSQLESRDESTFLMDNDVVDGFSTPGQLESTFDNDFNLHHKNKISTLQKTEQKSNKSPIIYKNIKKKLRDSFCKGKTYLKKETNLFSSLPKPKDIRKQQNSSYRDSSTIWNESDLGINDLYSSETPSVLEQLQKTVSLCRKIPYFDSTLETVEAERLLLYSTLKTENVKKNDCRSILIPADNSVLNGGKILIESFKLSLCCDISRDIFFNYFYIAVFSYDTKIKSSNFGEKLENTIIFRNCNIIFDSVNQNSNIKCDIYMLRLRKILNASSIKNQDEQLITKMENLEESYESSGDELLSRFKHQGCFEFDPRNFIPYKIDQTCKISELDNIICLQSKKSITIPLNLVARRTYLKNEVNIQATLEVLFPKFQIEGFISVQDIKNKHNWNRYWCKLDDFVLKMWNYPQDSLDKDCIYSFNLCKCLTFPVNIVDRSLCARLRSFILTILIDEKENNCYSNIFFSADNQDHLKFWIDGLNRILDFVNFWMKPDVEENIELSYDC